MEAHEYATLNLAFLLDQQVPQRTGELRDAQEIIEADAFSDPMVGVIEYDTPVANWTNEGRGPVLPIPPNTVLRWVEPDGTVVFARSAGPAEGTRWWDDVMTEANWSAGLAAGLEQASG